MVARGEVWLVTLDPSAGQRDPQGEALPDRLAAGNARLLAHGDCGSYD